MSNFAAQKHIDSATAMFRKKFLLLMMSFLVCTVLNAQTGYPVERSRDRNLGISGGKGGMERMLPPKADASPGIPSDYKGYTDDSFQELEKKMKEREWGSEDTAWNRACEIDTRQSYEKYTAMYPNGAHIVPATIRLINAKIDETLANAHNELPNIKHVEEDENSLTSTIEITNNTGYPLTIYCSGEKATSFVIPPDRSKTITVDNGTYKLAAYVPPSYIRPYAGQTGFTGGRYEIGFWVVSM